MIQIQIVIWRPVNDLGIRSVPEIYASKDKTRVIVCVVVC